MSRIIRAQENSLGSLFYVRLRTTINNVPVDIEQVPEPYRLKKDLYITIPFETFKRYVLGHTLPEYLPDKDFPTIRRVITSGNPRIYRYYLDYLSYAQFKELAYAHNYRARYVTRFIPQLYDVEKKTIPELLSGFRVDNKVTRAMLKQLKDYDYNLDITCNQKSPEYKQAFALACFYKWKSYEFSKQMPKMFNIEVLEN